MLQSVPEPVARVTGRQQQTAAQHAPIPPNTGVRQHHHKGAVRYHYSLSFPLKAWKVSDSADRESVSVASTQPFPHACYSTHNSAELGSQSMHNSPRGGMRGEDERLARGGVKPEDTGRGDGGWMVSSTTRRKEQRLMRY